MGPIQIILNYPISAAIIGVGMYCLGYLTPAPQCVEDILGKKRY